MQSRNTLVSFGSKTIKRENGKFKKLELDVVGKMFFINDFHD